MKEYKRDRKSPPYSANDYPVKTYGVGIDGKVWCIGTVASRHDRPSGYKRWLKAYATVDGLGIERTPSPEMVGYDDFIKRKTMSEEKSLEDIFDLPKGDDKDRDIDDDFVSTLESGEREDKPESETIVEDEPEVHIPTVMSKIRGSVDTPEEFKFTDDGVFYSMLRNIYRGKSILVTGPSGCGKSSLGKILAEITDKPFYAFNFGDTMNPAAKLLGDTKFDKERGTWFKPSRFVSALRDLKGAFIMLDEVTRDRTGDLANILMPVLDGQRYLALDESEDADVVKIDDGAFFYATANIGREYLGASHDLDRAWKDRFTGGIYELEYLPQVKERELLMIRNPNVSEKDANHITDFASRVRALYKSEELNTAVSTRMCLTAADLVTDGMDMLEALKMTCLPFYPIQGGDDTERVRVIQAIQSMGE
jgi:MoxR-like ATPase